MQKAARRLRTEKGAFVPAIYVAVSEYGDSTAHACEDDANACKAGESIAKDDARGNVAGENARSMNAQRERAPARQDDFNSKNTPDPGQAPPCGRQCVEYAPRRLTLH